MIMLLLIESAYTRVHSLYTTPCKVNVVTPMSCDAPSDCGEPSLTLFGSRWPSTASEMRRRSDAVTPELRDRDLFANLGLRGLGSGFADGSRIGWVRPPTMGKDVPDARCIVVSSSLSSSTVAGAPGYTDVH